MIKRVARSYSKNLVSVLLVVAMLVPSASVFALTEEQKQVIDSGAEYFNVEEDTCSASSNPDTAANGNGIYVIGDSLTVGMNNPAIGVENTLQTVLSANGWAPTINAHGCRPVYYPNVAQEVSEEAGACTTEASIVTSAFKELEKDSLIVASARAVVIALGTNKAETNDAEFKAKSIEYIDNVRAINSGIGNRIFWVNLYSRSNALESRNQIIKEIVAEKGIQLIDYRSVAIDEAVYPFQDSTQSQVHLNNTGYVNKAKFIAEKLSGPNGTVVPNPVASAAGFDALSLTFPAFPNESEIGTSITSYIRERRPQSPWFTVDADIGTWLVRESKTRNINPLLITAVGQQENNFGSGTQRHVVQYYNYFGMKGSTPIDIPGSSYKGFSSPTEGMTYFMDKVKQNTQSADRGLYKDVLNLYDYFGMHQSGAIAYPGEPLDPGDQGGPGGRPDGDRLNGWDEAMKVYMSWDVNKNDGPPTAVSERGRTFNPGIYYKNSIDLINKITGLNLSDVPVRGGGGVVVACVGGAAGGSGKVDGKGYSFPLAPQTRAVGGIQIGQTVTSHHDYTPAFDLSSTDSADVFALYSGVATVVSTDYKGISGCSSIQFKADDGFYYWYGHLKNPTIQEGSPVKAGDKIAELADRANYGSDCWGGFPHLHIDRGCLLEGVPQTAGRKECRDPDFIPFLSSIYAELPNN